MSLAIVGSRNFQDYALLKEKIDEFMKTHIITTIISGGAKGADNLAEKYAKEHQLKLVVFMPNWNKYGLSAGPLRNSQIVEASDYLIAFPSKSGRGTQDSIRKAEKKGIPTVIHWID